MGRQISVEEIARRVSEGERERFGEIMDYNTKPKINETERESSQH